MSDTILPAVSLGNLSGLPMQEPVLEGLPSGLSSSNDLKLDLLKSFEQSLRDSLETNEEADQSAFACMIPLSVETSNPVTFLSLPPAWQSGKVLPQQQWLDGKDLPQTQSPQASGVPLQPFNGLFNLIRNPEARNEAQFDWLQTARVKVSEGIEGISERLQQPAELRPAASLAGQYTVIGSHTDITSAAPRAAGPPTLTVDVPVGQPDWDKAVGERIQWMLGKHVQEAEVKLNPPHLGPLEVRISLQHDQANVHFMASQAPTREALEAALPRLREMFADANLGLLNVNVGQREGSGQHPTQHGGYAGHVASQEVGMGDPASSLGNTLIRIGTDGMVDDYA
jgi:hypothetical protein